MMKRSVLYLGTEGGLGSAVALCGALGAQGTQVACAILTASEAPARDLGLARRLDPARPEVTVFEGALPGGGRAAMVVLARNLEDRHARFANIAAAALRLDSWPVAILHAEAQVVTAAAHIRDRHALRASIVVDAKTADAVTDDIARIADRILVRASDQTFALSSAAVFAGGIHPVADPIDKPAAKRALRRTLALPPREQLPLIAVLTATPAQVPWDDLATADAQLVIAKAPTDRPEDTAMVSDAAARHRTRIAIHPDTAHLIAASDFALYPSPPPDADIRWLAPLRHGTLPIAPRSGVFADWLVEIDPGTRSGSAILFDPGAENAVPRAVRRAARAFCHPGFEAIGRRARDLDLGWEHAARRLTAVYDATHPGNAGAVSRSRAAAR